MRQTWWKRVAVVLAVAAGAGSLPGVATAGGVDSLDGIGRSPATADGGIAVGADRPETAASTVPPFPVPYGSLDLVAQDIVRDPTRDLVYASIGQDQPTGNTIAVIDLETWTVQRTVFAGSDPHALAVAPDGSRLYVSLWGAAAVAELSLPDLTVVRQFPLGTPGFTGPQLAEDIAVMPGRPGTIAVSLMNRGFSPRHEGVAVYDDGVARATRTPGHTGSNQIEFGTDPAVLYGYNNETTDFGFRRMAIDAGGVTITSSAPNLLSGFGITIQYAAGRIYGSDGTILDPGPPALVGRLAAPAAGSRLAMAVIGDGTRVWTVESSFGGGDAVLRAYDAATFRAVDAFTLPTGAVESFGTTTRLIDVGDGNLALAGSGGLYVMAPWLRRYASGEYTPLTPTRILDTRTGTGTGGRIAAIGSGEAIGVQVAGIAGVPERFVGAVVLNATVTEPSAGGFLTVWPTGDERPTISNLNFVPGQTVANLVTVALGDGGRLSIYNFNGSSHVVFDVVGYYSTASGTPGSRFRALDPVRLFDTRDPRSGVGGALENGATLTYRVAGVGGVPATGATAVVMNVTAVGGTAPGYLTVFPDDVPRPLASNVNFGPARAVPNLVVVRLPPSGVIDVYHFGGRTDVIADVVGYYDEDRSGERGRFVPLSPFRSIDTREDSPFAGDGALPPTATLFLGAATTPSSAWVLNVTVTGPTADGYLTVYPYPGTPPVASNVNFTAGQTVPNAAMVRTGPQVGFYNSAGRTHVVVDVFGVFT